jgi:glycosyltransferase involved in cell wall biosynthesis
MAESNQTIHVNSQDLCETGTPRVLIMIPAYNEAMNISGVIEGIRRSVPEADILVINDGSKDNTAHLSRSAGAHVITHPFNMGYGVTCQTGFKYANRKEYDYVVQMDGDGQHDPACIPAMLKVVQDPNVDVVLGSRWLGLTKYKGPLLRKFGKFFFGFLASLITKHQVTDPTTGFQAFTKKVVQFYCTEVYPVDYPDADMIIILDKAEFRVKEVPVIMYDSPTGQSMHSGFIKPIYYGMKMMMSITMSLFRDDRGFVQQWSQTPNRALHEDSAAPVTQTKENQFMKIIK